MIACHGTTRPAGGTTIIETLIAMLVATGVLLIIALMARALATTAAVSTRWSTQTGLLAAGFLEGLDRLDDWRELDDPSDRGRQLLRGKGMPFDDSAEALLAVRTIDDFAVERPLAWWRGCGATTAGAAFGDYGLFNGSGDGDGDGDGRWYGTMLTGLARRLGYYGLVDYAPACTLFHCYDGDGAPEEEFTALGESDRPGRFYAFLPGLSRVPVAADVAGATVGGGFIVTIDPVMLAEPEIHRRCFATSGPGQMGWSGILSAPSTPIAQEPLVPAGWPRLVAGVSRSVLRGRDVQRVSLRIDSPITGAGAAVTFSTVCTTLRGARRQRGLDAR